MSQKRTLAVRLRQAVGMGESKDWRFWFMIALVIGLVANIIVVIACLSPATRSLYLFRVSADDLVHAASKTTSVSAARLRVDGLPEYWYWGLTGTCATYTHGSVSCQRAFPPTMTIEEMILFAIKSNLDDPSNATHLVQPWTSALDQVQDKLAPSSHITTLLTVALTCVLASAALAVILFPLAILSLGNAHRRLPPWILYLVAFLDAAVFLTAGILVVFAMNRGPRGLINLSGIDQGRWQSYIGPGLCMLFVGVLFKLLSIELCFCMLFFVIFSGVFVAIMCASCFCNDDPAEDDTYPICEYPDDGNGKP